VILIYFLIAVLVTALFQRHLIKRGQRAENKRIWFIQIAALELLYSIIGTAFVLAIIQNVTKFFDKHLHPAIYIMIGIPVLVLHLLKGRRHYYEAKEKMLKRHGAHE
jgi:hypothetical protein